MSVTPVPGTNSSIAVGGTSITVAPANPNGGFILNPLSATDQGLSVAEVLYINPVTSAGLVGNGTTFALQPGQVWEIIPGQTTPTSANAASTGHAFSVVIY